MPGLQMTKRCSKGQWKVQCGPWLTAPLPVTPVPAICPLVRATVESSDFHFRGGVRHSTVTPTLAPPELI